MLGGIWQHAAADSFMDSLISQITSPNAFNTDEWLAKQATKKRPEFLIGKAEIQSQKNWAPATSWEAEDLEQSLLSDIEKALGKDQRRAMEGRIKVIEVDMQSMFQALPKNEYS